MALRKLPLKTEIPAVAGALTLVLMNGAGIAASGSPLLLAAGALALPGYFDAAREVLGTLMSRTFKVRTQARSAYMALSAAAGPILAEMANPANTSLTMAFTAFSAVALGTGVITGGQKPLPGLTLGDRVPEHEIRDAEAALRAAAEPAPDPAVEAALAAAVPRAQDKFNLETSIPKVGLARPNPFGRQVQPQLDAENGPGPA